MEAMIAKLCRRASLPKDVVQQVKGQGPGVGDRGYIAPPWSQRSSFFILHTSSFRTAAETLFLLLLFLGCCSKSHTSNSFLTKLSAKNRRNVKKV
jgi:hypothetical protein